MRPRASVVVPLTGDPDVALRCLVALSAVPDDPAHEVVVVDDASVGLGPLLERVGGDALLVRRPDRGGLLRAWSSGLERASGEVVVLLAGPAAVAPGFLAPLVAALDDPAVAAATAGAGDPVTTAAVALRRSAGPLLGLGPAPGGRPVAAADLVPDGAATGNGPAPDGRGVATDRAADRPVTADPTPRVPVVDPSIPDALAAAAVLTRVAAHGAVRAVAGSVVAPAPSVASVAPTAPRRDAAARGLERHPPGTPPELTVVIPTLDAAGDRLRRCVRAIQEHTDAPYEVVVVDNGAPPQGFTAPVNAGLRAARGRYAVVCNDDVEVRPGWCAPLRVALDAGHPVAFPWTVDGPMREDFAAWCFAVSREALDRHGVAPGEFLDPGLVVWYQDTDLLTRLRAAGTPPVLVRDSHVRHGLSETVASDDPALRAWIDRQVADDRRAFEARHGPHVVGAVAAG